MYSMEMARHTSDIQSCTFSKTVKILNIGQFLCCRESRVYAADTVWFSQDIQYTNERRMHSTSLNTFPSVPVPIHDLIMIYGFYGR